MPKPDETPSALARGIRFDLVIAVSALLISSLATVASWWQTRVIQQQFSAQVWPYVSISEALDGETETAEISIANDGLGPAILRTAIVQVDGRERTGLIDALHAIEGPNLMARAAHAARSPHEHAMFSLSESVGQPGSVLRAGASNTVFALRSRLFARPFVAAYHRMTIRLCYCALVPGTCWIKDTQTNDDPAPTSSCPPVRNNLMNESVDPLIKGTI
jgi:hypothetical protein